MAEFCKGCSIDTFGEDFGDFAGLTTPEDMKNGRSVVVLCEDCGHCHVDPDGKRIGKPFGPYARRKR